ncbi:MAG TPA: AI-2E family transporter [Pseudonocardiaceae bacterium]|nr:AI-2E family transporter [Pseudonocardiaceae bacterium]
MTETHTWRSAARARLIAAARRSREVAVTLRDRRRAMEADRPETPLDLDREHLVTDLEPEHLSPTPEQVEPEPFTGAPADENADTPAGDRTGPAAGGRSTGGSAAGGERTGKATGAQESDEAIARAEDAASRLSTPERPLGRPGRPLNHRSPFFVGLTGALGVAVTYGLLEVVVAARDVLLLIGLSIFLAIGLSPAVDWLTRKRLPRALSVVIVLFACVAFVGGFIASAVPPLVEQSTRFVQEAPSLWHGLQDHSSVLGQLNDRFHIQQRVTGMVSGNTGSLVQGLIGAGQVVFSALTDMVIVIVLTIYFLADLPRIRRTIYRLVPNSRRPRVILIGDEIFSRIGGFVLGNLITSLVAGLAVFVWAEIFGIPYPVLLALFAAIMDLIPVVGSTVAGVVVALVALSVSVPVALATVGYIVAYRLAEDYLLVPRIIGRTVRVPAITTVVSVLIGGSLLGVVGALVAIPVAAVIGMIMQEVLFPRLDRG